MAQGENLGVTAMKIKWDDFVTESIKKLQDRPAKQMDKDLQDWINHFDQKLDLMFQLQVETVKLLKKKGNPGKIKKGDPHDISGESDIPGGDRP
jgi:hypothetical protein